MKKLLLKMKKAVHMGYHSNKIIHEMKQLRYHIRHDHLIDKALNSKEPGVSTDSLCEHEVIVSLTTYGKRLYDVAPTIESIMQGSMRPNRIVLWLGDDLKEKPLPIALRKQQARGLEIAFCKDVRSYKKLVPALCKYQDAAIITIDDDAIYYYDLVEKLVNKHRECPHHIIANRIHRVVLGDDNHPVTYMKWKWCDTPTDDSPLNFFTGVGGVLYPPHSLDEEVLNEPVFMDICKFADDVWFYAMALKKGTRVCKCYTHNNSGGDFLLNDDVQDVGLLHVNTGNEGANDMQLKAVFEKYDLWDKLKEE